jgi:rod shape-determining protein MreD
VLLPTVLTAIAVLISVLPYGSIGGLPIVPLFSLIVVFYWSAYYPEAYPLFVPFVAGLLQDMLSNAPIGMTALVLLAVAAVTRRQRLYFAGNAALPEWTAFAGMAALAGFAFWAIGSIYFDQSLRLYPILFQAGLTILLYWPLARFQDWLRRKLTAA